MPEARIRRAYAATPFGQLHFAEAGSGPPVLLLHQTPRSWDEYRDVLPLLGRHFRTIAMDTLGFGASAHPLARGSIELYAEAAAALLDALAIGRAAVVGHHTGGVIAVELAARAPERVTALVLSSTPYNDAERRHHTATRPPIDEVPEQTDGTHLAALWQRRQAFYPAGRVDLLRRFVTDAVRHGDRVEEGHRAVHDYRMEDTIGLVVAPTLLIAAADDPFAFPERHRIAAQLPTARTVVIEGGGVPLPDQLPEPFATAVADFLLRQSVA